MPSGADEGAEPLADAMAAAQSRSRFPVAGQVDPAAAPATARTYPHQPARPASPLDPPSARASCAVAAAIVDVLGKDAIDQLALAGDGLQERISHGAHQQPAGT